MSTITNPVDQAREIANYEKEQAEAHQRALDAHFLHRPTNTLHAYLPRQKEWKK
jgi:hypothetical protein